MLLWWSTLQWLADRFTAPVYALGSQCDSESIPFENRTFIVGAESRTFIITESRTFIVREENRIFVVGCGDC